MLKTDPDRRFLLAAILYKSLPSSVSNVSMSVTFQPLPGSEELCLSPVSASVFVPWPSRVHFFVEAAELFRVYNHVAAMHSRTEDSVKLIGLMFYLASQNTIFPGSCFATVVRIIPIVMLCVSQTIGCVFSSSDSCSSQHIAIPRSAGNCVIWSRFGRSSNHDQITGREYTTEWWTSTH